MPVFHQVEGLAVDAGITLADLKGTLLTSCAPLFGDERRDPVPDALLPVHGALGRARHLLLHLQRRGLPHAADTRAGSRWAAPAWSTRTCSRRRLRPGGVSGFAFGCGLERIAHAAPRHPRPPRSCGTTTCACCASSDERSRFPGCASTSRSRCRSTSSRRACPSPRSRSSASSTRGVPDSDGNLGLVPRRPRRSRPSKHPNADRLQLCQVDVGEGEPRQIVCGAWNFGAGATVAVALPGAVLPSAADARRARAARQVSDGMILAEHEVGLGDDHAGIMLLPDGLEPGTPLADVLPIRDARARRRGRPSIAPICSRCTASPARSRRSTTSRSAAGARRRPRDRRPTRTSTSRVEDFDGCPRYIGRLFRGRRDRPVAAVAAVAALPRRACADLERRRRHELRHARARATRSTRSTSRSSRRGRIVVRRARPGEELRTLDGDARRLDAGRPASSPTASAQSRSRRSWAARTARSTDDTASVLLEAANFEPLGILRDVRAPRASAPRARTAGRRASTRTSPSHAAVLATQPARRARRRADGPARRDVQRGLPERPVVHFRPERAVAPHRDRDVPRRAASDAAGARVRGRRTTGDVIVPTWRARDVTREVDVIEEIARFRASTASPTRCRCGARCTGRLTREQRLRRRVEDVARRRRLRRRPTRRASSPRTSDPDALRLPSPITSEPGDPPHVAAAEPRRGGPRGTSTPAPSAIALFEIARVYLPCGEQLPTSAGASPASSRAASCASKGVVETLYAALKARAPSSSAAQHRCSTRARPRATEAGVARRAPPARCSTGVGSVRARPRDALRRGRRSASSTRTSSRTRPIRQDIAVAVAEEVPVGDARGRRARGGRRRSCARPRLRRLPRRAGRRGPQVGRASRSPSSRPSAR